MAPRRRPAARSLVVALLVAMMTPLSAAPSATAATCASSTLATMTQAHRIGQLFNIGLPYTSLTSSERAAIASYHFGSVWYARKTSVGVTALRVFSDSIQAQGTWSATRNVRFFIAANQEGGRVQALNGPGFDVIPTALTQGTWSRTYLRTKAARWGSQLRAAGVNLDFAPVADIVPPGFDSQNAPIGQLQREFAHYPTPVAGHVAAFILGMRDARIATTAKHFPGLGRVTANTDFASDVTDTVTTRYDAYLQPFAWAASDVPFVMVSLATYERIDPDHLAAFSPTIIKGMLRGDLAFKGVVMSDSLSATAVSSVSPGTRAIRFIAAGGDMIVLNPLDQAITMHKALTARAQVSTWFRTRIDTAALEVLNAKDAAGLLPCS